MKLLEPSSTGSTYQTWLLILPYLHYPKNNQINNHADVGYRLSTIITCWAMLESFVRHALHDKIIRDFKKLKINEKYFNRLNNPKLKLKDIDLHLYRKNIITASWGELKNISEEMNLQIKSINHNNWEFLIHMYSLRNRFVHGVEFVVMKGTKKKEDDVISVEYHKALKYLEKQKLFKLDELIKTQEINIMLNKSVTDFLIHMSLETINELSILYKGSSASITWKNLNNKAIKAGFLKKAQPNK